MGNCSSCSQSRISMTAKLILSDGQLQEFGWPVKVAFLSQENSDCFISNSNEMDIGRFLAAMEGDEVLQLGEIYFELPTTWQNQPMKVEDMAVLACKASLALARNDVNGVDNQMVVSCCCSGPKKVEPLKLFSDIRERPLLPVRRPAGAGRLRHRRFVRELSAIVEE